ncbi:hypothetical protein QBC44DRAFT_243169 [Cladorrhinum sp. PSN332]|nr:hypothetical protein QBC44DRAFT_243169 [Cladorrhinum sp. PSN332]
MASSTAAPVTEKDQIILYHYPFSPYARRITWYLRLRQIPYLECIQPPILPRPDLSLLGISYRRIPLLSHNSSVYLDTRLILSHLERSPSLASVCPPLSASAPAATPEAQAVQSLLSTLTTQTDLFFSAAALLPPSLPLMKNKQFLKDRADFFPSPSDNDARSVAGLTLKRAEALSAVRDAIRLLETTILSDGRRWVLKTEKPSLGDVEGIWPFHWLLSEKSGIKGAIYDDEVVNETKYPRVFGWVRRFEEFLGGLDDTAVGRVKGEEGRDIILAATAGRVGGGEGEYKGNVDGGEPVVKALGLKRGHEVEVWPTDSGSNHRDRGVLVGLDEREVVWVSEKGVRVHAPRRGFRVTRVGGGNEGKL